MSPSHQEKDQPRHPKRINSADAPTRIAKSGHLVSRCAGIEHTQAHIPRIKRMFAMSLPTMFPTTMFPSPETQSAIVTAISGALVPTATIVAPTTNEETFIFLAMLEAPSTRNLAPATRRIIPAIKRKISPTACPNLEAHLKKKTPDPKSKVLFTEKQATCPGRLPVMTRRRL